MLLLLRVRLKFEIKFFVLIKSIQSFSEILIMRRNLNKFVGNFQNESFLWQDDNREWSGLKHTQSRDWRLTLRFLENHWTLRQI